MHILIIPSWYPNENSSLSGIFFQEQAEALARNTGLTIGCIAMNESPMRYIISPNITSFKYSSQTINSVHTINFIYPMVNRLKFFKYIFIKQIFKILFKRYIRKYGLPDIVHLHSFYHGDLALYLKEKYDIPYVVTEHSSAFSRDMLSLKEVKYADKVFRNASIRIAVSEEFKNLLEKKFNLQFKYIPNLIDTDFFSLKHQRDKNDFLFINIAFLNKSKNHDMLIKAFHQAFKNNDNVKLVIVGDGVEYSNLKGLVKTFNMEKQIILHGKADRHEVKRLLQNSNAFVLSSEYETFGVVILEAMSCGLPAVSTECGGPESIIVDNKLGLLSEINVFPLAYSMKYIYENTYDSTYIRKYVLNHFSEDIVCKKILDMYKKIHE